MKKEGYETDAEVRLRHTVLRLYIWLGMIVVSVLILSAIILKQVL